MRGMERNSVYLKRMKTIGSKIQINYRRITVIKKYIKITLIKNNFQLFASFFFEPSHA